MPVAEETAKPTEGKSTGTEAEPTGEAQGGATPESDPAKGKIPDQTIPEGGVVIDTSDVPGTTGANLPESNPKPEGGSSASDQTTVVHPPQPEGSTHQEGSGALNDESTSPQPPHPEDQNQAGKSTVLDAESAAEAQFDSDTVEDIDFDALESEDSDSDSDSSIEKFGDFDIEPDSDLHDYLDSEIDPAIAASTRFSKGLTAEERTTLLKKFKQVDDEARLVKEASAKYTESEKVKFKDKQEPYSPILIHYERKSLASSFSSKFRLKANIQTFEAIALRSYGSWGLIVNRACRRPLGPRVEFEAARKQYLTFINDIHFMVRDPEKLTLNDYNRVLSKLNIATNSKDPAVKMRMKTELEIFDTAKFMVADNEERISSAAVSFIDGLIEKYSGYFESNDFLYRVSRAEKGVYASDAELASRGMDAAKQIRVGDVVYESALISTSADSLSAMFKYSAVELGGKGATNYLPENKKIPDDQEEVLFVIRHNRKVPSIDISAYKFPEKSFKSSSSEFLLRSNSRFKVIGILDDFGDANPSFKKVIAIEPLASSEVAPDDPVRNIFTGVSTESDQTGAGFDLLPGEVLPEGQDFDPDSLGQSS